ncbi:MAG: SpoIID/LytB domain-containing protein, partial [Acidobacteriaceae bacterium]|nr:SpoIID/LytB domain-containing protein [Acidobacteriaceae bacterium]
MTRGLVLVIAFACSSAAQVTYKVRLTAGEGGRIVELPAEKYVAGVLAGESSVFKSDEALKAMAISARTYAARLKARHGKEGYDFCATTHCQRVVLDGITDGFTRAAQATAGELLWFDGNPAFSVYTRNCGGNTEDVRAVWPDVQTPYLRAHADPYCLRGTSGAWSWSARPDEIVSALRASQLNAPQSMRLVSIAAQTPSGRNRNLYLEGDGGDRILISASSFRFAIGRALGWNTLRSERYQVEDVAGRIVFRGAGEGHGIGLCQAGADEMGQERHTYREILAFYYPGTTIGRSANGFKWVRLGGEGVAVFTTRPEQDGMVLAIAESLARDEE